MTASMLSEDVKLLPKITYPDFVNYLVFSPSPYTSDDLKSYKGLEAYNQFVVENPLYAMVRVTVHDTRRPRTAKYTHTFKIVKKNRLIVTSASRHLTKGLYTCAHHSLHIRLTNVCVKY